MDNPKGPFTIIKTGENQLKIPGRPIRVLGIDLGTTNSTVSEIVWDPDHPSAPEARCLEVEQPTLEGSFTHVLVPSVVAIHDRRVLVGEGAKRLRARAVELGLEQNRDLFYECKNDIGIRKTYHRAPEGFRSAAEIGGHVVRFIVDAAMAENPQPIDKIVVTVPASFQLAQRHDTIRAMRSAGLEVSGGDLIDEPVAAYLDHVLSRSTDSEKIGADPENLLVFDFGGGTCDIAVLKVKTAEDVARLDIAPLAVSRYHRLGGGDIDRAVVHEELIPLLIQANALDDFSLGYEEKKRRLEPSLLDIAEGLKIGISTEIRRLRSFGKYDQERENLSRSLPEHKTISIGSRELKLEGPSLSATRFEELLEPFLDRDILYPKETDYLWTCSIFAPLQDALDRSGVAPDDVDLCLLVGGSSLIPQISDAVRDFLPRARVLRYEHSDDVKACVSRGAAYHALSLALFGHGLVRPVCPEAIAIQTARGPVELVPGGTPLPFPSDNGMVENRELRVPENSVDKALPLRLELIASGDSRTLGQKVAGLAPPVFKNDELLLRYRLDENQDLRVVVSHGPDRGGQAIEMDIENPLTNVVNPQTTRIRIEETEEELRTGKLDRDEKLVKLEGLAFDCSEIGHLEKALAHYRTVLKNRARPDASLLTKMALVSSEIGDFEREEKFYREAAAAAPKWGGPLFNLSLSQKRRGKTQEAIDSVDMAITRERYAPYVVLRAELAEHVGAQDERDRLLDQAIASFGPPSTVDDWELTWLTFALRLKGDAEGLAKAQEEQRRRSMATGEVAEPGGVLPDVQGGRLVPREG